MDFAWMNEIKLVKMPVSQQHEDKCPQRCR